MAVDETTPPPRRGRPVFLWLALAIIALAALLLVFRGGDDAILGLADNRFAQLAGLIAISAFLFAGLIGRTPVGRLLRQAIAWAAIFIVVLVGYTYRDELEWMFRRVSSELFPGTAMMTTDGETNEVIVTRSGGHFNVRATVNNAPVEMMIDTGASVVTLSAEDAWLAGYTPRARDYVVQVSTANGVALAAPVVIERLAIGSIRMNRVAALVAQPGMLETSLLGLNFLNELQSFTISGNRMTLTP